MKTLVRHVEKLAAVALATALGMSALGCSSEEGISRRLQANGEGGSAIGSGGSATPKPTGGSGGATDSDDATPGNGSTTGSGGYGGAGSIDSGGAGSSGGTGGNATGTGGATTGGGSAGRGGPMGGSAGGGGSATGGSNGSGGGVIDGAAGRGGVRDASIDRGAGGSTSNDAASGVSDGSTETDVALPPRISTDPNLKVAFLGDTDTGSNFKKVLDLVKAEGAEALVVQGDMSYAANPTAWWDAAEAVLGTSFPIFISRGNHDDSSWSSYLPEAAAHLDGATRIAGAHDANYKTIWRGLVLATIKQGDKGSNLTPFLEDEPHVWKICQWHQNQAAMQVGGKTDEMGWEVYETCRKMGAIIQTGHEHSYERTKTLVDITKQIVDTNCDSTTDLCVGPGRTFVNVVGLGGQSIRPQLRCLPASPPYGCVGEWAFIYTTNQSAALGAQFITFHAGDPQKANGYFKNVNGVTVDTFTITADP